MSIQWTFIAGFLYVELAIVTIMLLPIFSPRRWNQFFKSRLFEMFRQRAAMYFYVLIGVLCLFLMDAVREMRKYSHGDSSHVHLASEMKGNVKLFRAQRNFYITGFAIFLSCVIRRLVKMLMIQDELTIKAERIIKEAESTVKLAKTTVLANSIQTEEAKQYQEIKSKLEDTESLLEAAENLLEEEKNRTQELEREVNLWKLKFEEVTVLRGKGDA